MIIFRKVPTIFCLIVQVHQQVMELVVMLQSKVNRIHVLAVCLRLDNEVSNLIKELNLFF